MQRFATSALLMLLISSAALSLIASNLTIVHLPAGDVWQHMSLIEQAAMGNITAHDIFQTHNQLHFIPVPKIVYALDLIFFSGSGLFTAYTSMALTLLCSLLFCRLLCDITVFENHEKTTLSLLMASWLVCILQWESFINPANLQWSGMSAGLALIAAGFRQRPLWLAAGVALAIGCGAQWWILLAAAAITLASRKTIFATIATTGIAIAVWEFSNVIWLQHYPPLPVIALSHFSPIPAEQLAAIKDSYFNSPLLFYLDTCKNLLVFIARFCMPPINQWLDASTILWLSFAPLLAWLLLAKRDTDWRGFTFMATAALLTAIAAGIVRGHFTYAYTSRFANSGLLFVCACFALGYAACRHDPRKKYGWWLLAALYSALLMVSAYREAGAIVQGSNHRRLSQVGYALDIQDMHATSETPYATLMALNFRETNERKGVLADHQLGVYHSQEHQIFNGQRALPERDIPCTYNNVAISPLKSDQTARRIIGQAIAQDGQAMSSILIRSNTGQPLGYGISRVVGRTLAEQLGNPRQFSGFFHVPEAPSITIVAYTGHKRCQPETIPLPQ